jgi:hypothetical protein
MAKLLPWLQGVAKRLQLFRGKMAWLWEMANHLPWLQGLAKRLP